MPGRAAFSSRLRPANTITLNLPDHEHIRRDIVSAVAGPVALDHFNRIFGPGKVRETTHLRTRLASTIGSSLLLEATVLPRRRWCDGFVSNAHGVQSACNDSAIDAIPIADEVTWRVTIVRAGRRSMTFEVDEIKSMSLCKGRR